MRLLRITPTRADGRGSLCAVDSRPPRSKSQKLTNRKYCIMYTGTSSERARIVVASSGNRSRFACKGNFDSGEFRNSDVPKSYIGFDGGAANIDKKEKKRKRNTTPSSYFRAGKNHFASYFIRVERDYIICSAGVISDIVFFFFFGVFVKSILVASCRYVCMRV